MSYCFSLLLSPFISVWTVIKLALSADDKCPVICVDSSTRRGYEVKEECARLTAALPDLGEMEFFFFFFLTQMLL